MRSGAAISMPGMMDTDAQPRSDGRSAFGLAHGLRRARFRARHLAAVLADVRDTALDLDLAELIEGTAPLESVRAGNLPRRHSTLLEQAILAHIGGATRAALAEPSRSWSASIEAVFRSWDSARAKAYRRHHGISDDLGTAVTIQAMVFGTSMEFRLRRRVHAQSK